MGELAQLKVSWLSGVAVPGVLWVPYGRSLFTPSCTRVGACVPLLQSAGPHTDTQQHGGADTEKRQAAFIGCSSLTAAARDMAPAPALG